MQGKIFLMYFKPSLNKRLETKSKLKSAQAVSGGCINQVTKLSLSTGQQVLLKLSDQTDADFQIEADGLAAIAATQTCRVPNTISVGQTPQPYLLLEWIETMTPGSDFWPRFGQQLAALHSAAIPWSDFGMLSETFGYRSDNVIGATPQINTRTVSWSEFFCNQRLRFQFDLAANQGHFSAQDRDVFERFLKKVRAILEGLPVTPSLIHGDLWSGNFLCDRDQQPVLIDPAVSWSHSEFEFGIMKMFGGFKQPMYDAYDEFRPAIPGVEQRIEIYSLYHYLNHLNLFGRSYLQNCWQIIRKYT